MKTSITLLLALGALVIAFPAMAKLSIFTCEPEWGSLAQELGGDKASVFSATTALQDPHRVEARPSLIARVRTADLLVCTGAELEIGWLPLLLTQSGNARVQPGSSGYLEASQHVAKLEIPQVVDRSLGDIHPSGNPHVHLDPRNIARVAEVLGQRMAQLDPGNASAYKERASSFQQRWQSATQRWERDAAKLKGVAVVGYHKDFSYFIHWAGMRQVGSLEPKPGIPPTPTHLAELIEQMKRDPAKAVIYSAYNSPRAAEFLAERAKIPTVMMPYTVGGSDSAKDLFGLFDDTIARLLAVVK
jgi:zinc/manganese transport system substrate-binding protein